MNKHPLRLRFLGIDTQREHVVYMRRDCHVCRSEGFKAQTRLEIALGARRIVATLSVIDNRRLAQVAKLAGAPGSPAAGLELHVHRGTHVERGMPLFTLHAESQGELDYAKAYYEGHSVFEVVDAR